jgi:hypothetical protein
MAFASGIHINTMLSKNNDEYGEFVSYVESIIPGSQ